MERIKLLTLYLEPETRQIILETNGVAKSMSLAELRLVAEHLQGWVYDIAKVALRASGWQGKINKEGSNGECKEREE